MLGVSVWIQKGTWNGTHPLMVAFSDLRSSWKALEATLNCAAAVPERAAARNVMNFMVDWWISAKRHVVEALC
jgi:hypothetical protein